MATTAEILFHGLHNLFNSYKSVLIFTSRLNLGLDSRLKNNVWDHVINPVAKLAIGLDECQTGPKASLAQPTAYQLYATKQLPLKVYTPYKIHKRESIYVCNKKKK